jgi:5-oxoprolinase (ATP-hydrolysing)
MSKSWEFWIDRGGTFTDIIARREDGQLFTAKQLSVSPLYKDAAVSGIKKILQENGASLADLRSVRMGTTVGTNALLERNGARTVLVTTKGFADALRIGYQQRPNIFALEIILPEMLYEEVIEFDERVDAAGHVLQEGKLEQLRERLTQVRASGIDSCAIALLHAYKFPAHELQAAAIAREVGFHQISMSHDCAALMKYVSRADTTLVDAYLTPLLRQYIGTVQSELGSTKLSFMQSNGGLADSSMFRGKDSILSGPAGGLVGAIKSAQASGFANLITFDMGGTSTDVAYFGGEIEHIYDAEISGMRIRAPMLDIHTVAAGGGSILTFDGSRLRVGPDSAGAIPGPLCYKRNGPLALTDANVLLGRIQPQFFPRLFGAEGNESLDIVAVQTAFAKLANDLGVQLGEKRRPEEIAMGFIKIAVAKMANAIKHVSVQRGHDPRECLLVCFGGAGGQHACLLADELGIKNILIHPLAGLLSAFGIGLAETRLAKDLDINLPILTVDFNALEKELGDLQNTMKEALLSKGVDMTRCQTMVQAFIYMEGSDYSLPVAYANANSMSEAFNKKHLARYGFTDPNRKLILSRMSVQVVVAETEGQDLKMPAASQKARSCNVSDADGANANVRIFHEEWQPCPLVAREEVSEVDSLIGPAIIVEDNTTTILDRGWKAIKLTDGSLLLTAVHTAVNNTAVTDEEWQPAKLGESDSGSFTEADPVKSTRPKLTSGSASSHEPEQSTQMPKENAKPDPITLELFNSLFRFVAEQMGITLQNTSQSVNIKERLDFSCALFDADGNLVANAPHIPVHLGSMGEAVKNLLADKGNDMRPGDAYASNDPYNGGTHLPDITVITPCFDASGRRLLFFVASRGHHSDIGGITPGSMPADSHTIEEEGCIFQNMLLMRAEQILEKALLTRLTGGKYPSRKPSQNLADLKAQIAANVSGEKQMRDVIAKWGERTVLAYMGFVQDNAEDSVKRAIRTLRSGAFASTMDDGSVVSVRITIDNTNATAHIDFSGTSLQTSTNFNAPLAVCKAAVLFVFRTLVDDEIPLNAGCFRPLQVEVPQGCLLNPKYPAPVVAGNVETSQVIVDVLYGALGIMASSQGTMNNLSFGNERYQYYETICGGTGAGANFNGAGPVQSNMTNSRLTDPEVLETQLPVRLESFSVRRGSGGKGMRQGGDGALRRIRFNEKMTASILSNRRLSSPHGLAGGTSGEAGNNFIERSNGQIEKLAYRASVELNPGDCLCIETPGGGGFGEPISITDSEA